MREGADREGETEGTIEKGVGGPAGKCKASFMGLCAFQAAVGWWLLA